MTYKDLPLLTDHDRVVATMIADFSNRTGATVHEAHPVAALMQAIGRRIVDNRIILVDEARDFAVQFGALIGVTRIVATASTAVGIWAASDRDVLVPAGTIIRTGGEWDWVTDETTLVTQQGTKIRMTAAHLGPEPAQSVNAWEIVTRIDGVALRSIADVVAGNEEEPLGVFLDRLAGEAKIMSLVPRLTHEYAQLLMRDPRVERAFAVSGWDPTTGQTNLDRVVGIVALGVNGAPFSKYDLAQLEQHMMGAGNRPANMIVKITNATRVPVTIQWKGIRADGVTAEAATTAGNAAVVNLIDVRTWRLHGDQRVRINDVIGALWATEEIEHVTEVRLNGASQDVVLSALGSLPALTLEGAVV